MKLFVQLLVLFLAITGASSILMSWGNLEFGNIDYWQRHGIFLLFFITLFPRLTLLFSSIPFGGLFWWIGFFFAPRLLVAILATLAYWQINPILVLIAWFIAISGETAEKWGFNQQISIRVGGNPFRSNRHYSQGPKKPVNENIVDAEFRRMDDSE